MFDLAEFLYAVSSSHNERVYKISSQSDIGKYVFQTPAFREITNKFPAYTITALASATVI